jgi:hypothetical protein
MAEAEQELQTHFLMGAIVAFLSGVLNALLVLGASSFFRGSYIDRHPQVVVFPGIIVSWTLGIYSMFQIARYKGCTGIFLGIFLSFWGFFYGPRVLKYIAIIRGQRR